MTAGDPYLQIIEQAVDGENAFQDVEDMRRFLLTSLQEESLGAAELPGAGEPTVIPRGDWEWFGSPLHFVASWSCHFHLGTLIGGWVVSTVGEYISDPAKPAKSGHDFEEIGSGRKYETYVFRATGERCDRDECHCGQPEWEGLEVYSEGYNERGAAQRGHYAMCEKVAALAVSVPAQEQDEEPLGGSQSEPGAGESA